MPDKQVVLGQIQQFGDQSVSFLTAYDGYRHFEYSSSEGKSLVPYMENGVALIAASEPLGPVSVRAQALQAFFNHAKSKSKIGVALPVSADLQKKCQGLGYSSLQIGVEPWIDLPTNFKKIAPKKLSPEEFRLEKLSPSEKEQVGLLIERWKASRKSAPLGFLNRVDFWRHYEHKRFFRLKSRHKTVAIIGAVPIPSKNSWYLVDLIRDPEFAPTGSIESLVTMAVNTFNDEKVDSISLGLCPFIIDTKKDDRKNLAFHRFVRRMSSIISFFYDAQALYTFKTKLGPTRFEKMYLISSEKKLTLKVALGVGLTIYPSGLLRSSVKSTFFAVRQYLYKKSRTLLDPRLVTRNFPKTFFQLLMRVKVTALFITINALFYLVANERGGALRQRFREVYVFKLDRIIHPINMQNPFKLMVVPGFIHWDQTHFLSNQTLWLVAGFAEVLLGSRLMLLSATCGLVFTNVITAFSLAGLFWLTHSTRLSSLMLEQDVGASLAIFTAIGTLLYCLKDSWRNVFRLTFIFVVIAILKQQYMTLNHVIALVLGMSIARWYVPKNE